MFVGFGDQGVAVGLSVCLGAGLWFLSWCECVCMCLCSGVTFGLVNHRCSYFPKPKHRPW